MPCAFLKNHRCKKLTVQRKTHQQMQVLFSEKRVPLAAFTVAKMTELESTINFVYDAAITTPVEQQTGY